MIDFDIDTIPTVEVEGGEAFVRKEFNPIVSSVPISLDHPIFSNKGDPNIKSQKIEEKKDFEPEEKQHTHGHYNKDFFTQTNLQELFKTEPEYSIEGMQKIIRKSNIDFDSSEIALPEIISNQELTSSFIKKRDAYSFSNDALYEFEKQDYENSRPIRVKERTGQFLVSNNPFAENYNIPLTLTKSLTDQGSFKQRANEKWGDPTCIVCGKFIETVQGLVKKRKEFDGVAIGFSSGLIVLNDFQDHIVKLEAKEALTHGPVTALGHIIGKKYVVAGY